MNIIMIISSIMSVVSVLCWLIIFWQYITGRPYWGMERNSWVGPALFCGTIPMLNILSLILFVVVIAGFLFYDYISNVREKAIIKRSKEEEKRKMPPLL